jgi:hypothetical protein
MRVEWLRMGIGKLAVGVSRAATTVCTSMGSALATAVLAGPASMGASYTPLVSVALPRAALA